jgi:4'-phosphopantetheinyl transferase
MADARSWDANPANTILAEDEVHVWRAFLDCDAAILGRLEATLAPDEKSRADRFRFQRDRDAFVATRGNLRELLGKYAGRAPAELEFEYGERGKPFLRGNDAHRLQFNLSRSRGLAMYAFAVRRALGIDVEMVRGDLAAEKIAARFFGHDEVEELRGLPPSLTAEGFFLCWTRKEAYVKARGEGLRIPLNSFRVSLTPGQPGRLECEDGDRWSLYSFAPDPQYAGALVAEGKNLRVRFFDAKPQNLPEAK